MWKYTFNENEGTFPADSLTKFLLVDVYVHENGVTVPSKTTTHPYIYIYIYIYIYTHTHTHTLR